MPTDALVIAPAILAVVLVVSAVGKLRSPAASAQAFTALKVPRPLASPLVVRALPWVEIVLGLVLIVVGGWLGVVVSLAVLALFGAYFALVVRARGFETDVDCACFGSLGPGRITRVTVWRNTWLLALAVVSVLVATTGEALLARIIDGTAPWPWLLAAAAAALTVLLVLGTESSPASDAPTAVVGDLAVEEGDYLRVRTPALPVMLGDGTTTHLRRLSEQRPQLLLYVSQSCGSCAEVIDAVPGWRGELPMLDVRLVLRQAPESTTLTSTAEPLTLHDTDGLLAETFEMRGTPSALLLGADGLLAGGPTVSTPAVMEFVGDIKAELASIEV
ncbi:MauE/DoxX family redox-associated membrane protein [Humibacillus xanthopallidus]|uniref:Methylamine utilization protein MauE n=1 Tax=Humibacillus xanthopallidus TaxID=412689 RepID=A0A543I0H7_9MICO|nr:MauE/DoxX family redox-associated membrane protein [Humibacillus xanthopallidus]TQM63985.1 methylamine utilization protein MauE [Humibacillus xanthopallidus]